MIRVDEEQSLYVSPVARREYSRIDGADASAGKNYSIC